MRCVVFTGDREAEIRTLPDPCPGLGKVVIAVKASGLCGSDLRRCRVAKAERGDPARLKAPAANPAASSPQSAPTLPKSPSATG